MVASRRNADLVGCMRGLQDELILRIFSSLPDACSSLLRQKTNDAYADQSTGKGRQDVDYYSLKYMENDKVDFR